MAPSHRRSKSFFIGRVNFYYKYKFFLLFKPAGVHEVIVSNPVDLSAHQLHADLFYFFGRYPGVDSARLHLGAFQYNRPCSNGRVTADTGIVHYDGAHAYQYIVFYRTARHDGIVADRYIVADDRLRFFISAVDHRAVLDVHFIAYTNAVYITTYHRVEPNAATVTHRHIAHNSSIRRNKAILSKFGLYPFNR